ncbi:MAG: orotidine 5'-phosphate decarboxylase / HUMPS family protein [Candidatus Moraniibacteriota bacterium]
MKKENRIISAERSIIVAADVGNINDLYNLVDCTIDISSIGGYKLGFSLAFLGLRRVVEIIQKSNARSRQNKKIIFDFQKAGNDIPETGKIFAQSMLDAGVDTVILFPFTGPVTQQAWTEACLEVKLNVIIGGVMTHPGFLQSENGYIVENAPYKIYQKAIEMGIKHFVVPGSPRRIGGLKKVIELLNGEVGHENYALYAPGFISQGGDIGECAKIISGEWHAIVGSAIYKAENMREAAIRVCSQI